MNINDTVRLKLSSPIPRNSTVKRWRAAGTKLRIVLIDEFIWVEVWNFNPKPRDLWRNVLRFRAEPDWLEPYGG